VGYLVLDVLVHGLAFNSFYFQTKVAFWIGGVFLSLIVFKN
jgi:hypothetical protein